MKLGLFAVGILATSCAIMGFGCVDETGTNATTGSSSSSSSSSTSGMTSSSGEGGSMGGSTSSSSGTGGSMSSSSSSSSSGVYGFCSDCTSNTTGAYKKECLAQAEACLANADCAAIATCSYDTCGTDKDGGCCSRGCANGKPMEAQTLFFALDNCIYCTTCKALCEPNSSAYCDSLNGVTMCP